MATVSYEITDGPSRWDLMLALFDACPTNTTADRIVMFSLARPDTDAEKAMVRVRVIARAGDMLEVGGLAETWGHEALRRVGTFNGVFNPSIRKGTAVIERGI